MIPDGQDMAPPQELPPLIFESSRLVYRGVEKGDSDFFHKLSQDTEASYALNPNLGLPRSKRAAEEFIAFVGEHAMLAAIICLRPPDAKTEDASKNPDGGTAAVEKPPEPIPIGHVMLGKSTPTMAHHRHAAMGIGILKEYRNAGYGSEAIQWILEWGFRMANLHRIFLECYGWNMGAAKLYKKLGFQLEGTKREHIWFSGRWHDALLFSMLENEWREIQKKPAGELVVLKSSYVQN